MNQIQTIKSMLYRLGRKHKKDSASLKIVKEILAEMEKAETGYMDHRDGVPRSRFTKQEDTAQAHAGMWKSSQRNTVGNWDVRPVVVLTAGKPIPFKKPSS